jgi:hypothetical protein
MVERWQGGRGFWAHGGQGHPRHALPGGTAPIEAFGPGIMYGLQPAGVSGDKRMTWAVGWFADGGQNDGDLQIAEGRVPYEF